MTQAAKPLDENPSQGTDEHVKLSVPEKLAYGVGDVGAAISNQVSTFFLNPFLLETALIRPGLVTIIVLVANIWDAIIDPVIGNVSDRTKTKWGRRRPWLLFGAIPFGIMFFLQFSVPPFGATALFVYFLFATVLLRTMYSIVNVPYTAMTPELTDDYDERTSITGFRLAFSVIGGLAASVFYLEVVQSFGEPRVGNMVAASILGVGIIASTLTTFFFTRERIQPAQKDEKQYGIIEGARIALQNRPFVLVLGIFLLAWLTVQFVQSVLFLYVQYWIGTPELFTRFLLIIQLTSFAFLTVWARISERVGKKEAYFIGVGIFIPLLMALFFVQPGQVGALYIICVLAGICVSMALLLPWSMLPDVIEYDELQTGQRRGGVFYGLFVFVQKIGLSVAVAGSTLMLDFTGYITPEAAGLLPTQPDSVLLTLRLFVSFIPAVLLVLSIPLAIAYPITRERFAEMQAELAARAQNAKSAE